MFRGLAVFFSPSLRAIASNEGDELLSCRFLSIPIILIYCCHRDREDSNCIRLPQQNKRKKEKKRQRCSNRR